MPVSPLTDPWTPVYEDQGIELFVDNLLSIFKRDQVAALAWASRGEALGPFKVFNNSNRLNVEWPVISAVPTEEATPTQNGFLIGSAFGVDIEVEDFGNDPDALARTVERRMRAVRQMIWAARVEDIMAGYPNGSWGVPTIEISKTIYTAYGNAQKSNYKQYANISVTLDLLET